MSIADVVLTPYAIPVLLVLYWLVPYLTSNIEIRNVPGPFFAKFTNLWLLAQARQGKRYLSVDQAHKKYGKLVRIQPNHVSVADENAINTIYGHGNGFLKSWVSNSTRDYLQLTALQGLLRCLRLDRTRSFQHKRQS